MMTHGAEIAFTDVVVDARRPERARAASRMCRRRGRVDADADARGRGDAMRRGVLREKARAFWYKT
jgi:hypothetical protein